LLVSICVLMYNEEESVALIYQEMTQALADFPHAYELLYVDNGSSDNSAKEVEKLMAGDARVRLFTIARNQGYGHGVIQGLQAAKGDVIGYMWGDYQIKAKDIVKVFRLAAREPRSLVKIRRVHRHDGWLRVFGSKVYNRLFGLLFKVNSRDANGCPKASTRENFLRMGLRCQDWLIDPEIMVKATRMGLDVKELDVVFFRREKGCSSVTLFTFASFLVKLLYACLFGRFDR